MQAELSRCRDSLATFRQMVFDIKEEIANVEEYDQATEKIRDNINLNYPDISMSIKKSIDGRENILTKEPEILADASLLPAY